MSKNIKIFLLLIFHSFCSYIVVISFAQKSPKLKYNNGYESIEMFVFSVLISLMTLLIYFSITTIVVEKTKNRGFIIATLASLIFVAYISWKVYY